MLGVELAVIDSTTLRVSCLSRRRPDTPERFAARALAKPTPLWQRGDCQPGTLRAMASERARPLQKPSKIFKGL